MCFTKVAAGYIVGQRVFFLSQNSEGPNLERKSIKKILGQMFFGLCPIYSFCTSVIKASAVDFFLRRTCFHHQTHLVLKYQHSRSILTLEKSTLLNMRQPAGSPVVQKSPAGCLRFCKLHLAEKYGTT